MKIQGKYIIAGILLLFSAGLAFDGLSNYINPYLSVSETTRNVDKYSGKNIQVMGIVAAGSLNRGNGSNINFILTDHKESLAIKYSGALPQNFGEGKDIVAVGSLTKEERLEATKLLVKCPSKYEGTDPPQHMNYLFLAAIGLAVLAILYIAITTLWKRS
jgi:cytochrome c-type biogenesis protein CcmE